MKAPLSVKFEQHDEGEMTFRIEKEGHTLGNTLKVAISQEPTAAFVAYTVPHPQVDEMLLRVKPKEGLCAIVFCVLFFVFFFLCLAHGSAGSTAEQVVHNGIVSLSAKCERLSAAYTAALNEYQESNASAMDVDST